MVSEVTEKTLMKILAIKKLIIPTTRSGAIGDPRPSANSGKNLNMKKPMKTFAVTTAAFPMKWMMVPIPLVIKKDPAFLRARTKADIAEVQKFSPVKATWM